MPRVVFCRRIAMKLLRRSPGTGGGDPERIIFKPRTAHIRIGAKAKRHAPFLIFSDVENLGAFEGCRLV